MPEPVAVAYGERHPSGYCSRCWTNPAPPRFGWCSPCFFRHNLAPEPARPQDGDPPVGTTHDCPGGCGRPVPRHKLACAPDWFRLPLELRTAISRTYLVDKPSHMQLIAEAITWYLENPAVAK